MKNKNSISNQLLITIDFDKFHILNYLPSQLQLDVTLKIISLSIVVSSFLFDFSFP